MNLTQYEETGRVRAGNAQSPISVQVLCKLNVPDPSKGGGGVPVYLLSNMRFSHGRIVREFPG